MENPGGQGVDASAPTTESEGRRLAAPHVKAAIDRLVELLACDGRQAHVAANAARSLVDIAEGRDAAVERLVEAKLKKLIEEAKRDQAGRPLLRSVG
jgi:hypothetical protein